MIQLIETPAKGTQELSHTENLDQFSSKDLNPTTYNT